MKNLLCLIILLLMAPRLNATAENQRSIETILRENGIETAVQAIAAGLHSPEDIYARFGISDSSPQVTNSPLDQITLNYQGSTLYSGMGFVSAAGNLAYCSMPYGFHIVDLADPTTPVLLSENYAPLASGIAVSGNYAYVTTCGNGLQIFDVSAPANPFQIAALSGFCCARGIAVQGTFAYVVDGCDLRVVDISTPASPIIVATYVTPGNPEDVAISGSLAYIADGYDGLQIVDISTPAAPTFVGSYDTPGFARRLEKVSDRAYIADENGGLQIIDVSTPSGPVFLGSLVPPEGNVREVTVIGSTAHIAVFFGGMQSIDVSNPSAPVKISDYYVGSYNLSDGQAGFGNYVLLTRGEGLQVIDVSDPDGPSRIGTFDTPNYAFGVAASGGYAVVCDLDSVFVLDVSPPENPTRVAAFVTPNDPHDVEYSGNYAFIADGDAGLVVYDMTSPAAPAQLAVLPVPGRSVSIRKIGSRIYLGSQGGGFNIVDVSNPALPSLLGSYATPDQAWGVDVVGNTAYVSNLFNGFLILDISTPAIPVLLGGADTPGECRGITVVGTTAYVADGNNGMLVYDVSSPVTPIQIGAFDSPSFAVKIWIDGSLAYVDEATGIHVLDITVPATPTAIGYYEAQCDGTNDFFLSGSTGFLAQGNCGLFVVDFGAMPGGPILTARHSTAIQPGRMAIRGNNAYVVGGVVDMAIVDITNSTDPQPIASWDPSNYYSDAADVQIVGTRAFLAGNGFQILDISNPILPTLLGRMDLCCVEGLEVSGNYVYLAARDQGLIVVDISTIGTPAVVGSFDTPGYAYDVVKLGSYVAVSDLDSGVIIIDVSNPASPTFASRYQTTSRAWSLESNGTFVHVGTSSPNSGIVTLDLTIPSVPKFAGFMAQNFNGCPCAMDLTGGFLYVGGGYYGGDLHVFNVASPSSPSAAGFAATIADANGVAASGNKVVVGDNVGLTVLSSSIDTNSTLGRAPVAVFLNGPVYVASPPADTARLFVVELPGTIRLIKNGILESTPFLDITALTCDAGGNGLLGLAFDPNYATNGYFYVRYNDANCDVMVSRFTRSVNPDLADQGSEVSILAIDQPDNPNHNGGSIFFGQDGYLYIPNGDGTCCGDPENDAQNPQNFLGKILRIDVHSGSPYSVPLDNPFVGAVDTLPEIWAFGLRNPYRSSIDRETGDIYIADVGQDYREEISFQPALSVGGENYGWPIMEALECYNPPLGCATAGLTLPVHEYLHEDGNCSITGGHVYRGCAIPELQGRYVFGDFCTGKIWSIEHDGSAVTNIIDHSTDIESSDFSLVGFGEDAKGELYICDFNGGTVSKIVPRGVAPAACPGSFTCGDADGSGIITISDAVYLINYIFAGGPAPNPVLAGDADCSGIVNISDAVYLINYIFAGGPAPCAACP